MGFGEVHLGLAKVTHLVSNKVVMQTLFSLVPVLMLLTDALP